MNLSDDLELELTTLCAALEDGNLAEKQRVRLNELLANSEDARRFYLRHSALSASLFTYASEQQSDSPAPEPTLPSHGRLWMLAAASVIMALAVGAWVWLRPSAHEIAVDAKPADMVASLTGTKDCEWRGTGASTGDALHVGQRLQLQRGFAEVTFDSGAQVTLEAPASFVITSAWDATLERGALKANVPPEASGFRLSNDAVEVVDPAAEFSMIAEGGGNAEVLVLKGSAEATARDEEDSIVIHEAESRRFSAEGVTPIRDRDRKFARFARVLQLDRHPTVGGYAHWSFDEAPNSTLPAESRGRKKGTPRTELAGSREGVSALTEGRWGKALSFDGHLSARSNVPGISDTETARTIAFWMRVPTDASLASGAGGAISWGSTHKKHGLLHTAIGWNRQASQGVVGALRTDLGRSSSIGSTPLRDGTWHHVAVVFVPDARGSVQAKQYVDGRLEGSALRSMKKPRADTAEEATADTLWLGRSAGSKSRKNGFFHGDLDELFVLDRALAPQEIVRLMKENRPPVTMLVGSP